MANKKKINNKIFCIIIAAAALLLAGCGAQPVNEATQPLQSFTTESSISSQQAVSLDENAAPDLVIKTDQAPPAEAESPASTANDEAQGAAPQENLRPASPRDQKTLLECNFFDEQMFKGHLAGSKAAAEILDMQAGLKAAIIPHHLTAGDYITAVFEQAATEDFETVVFLAPNHTGQGGDVVFSANDWETPFGILACDQELTEFLMRDKQIKGSSNDTRMQEDHAISGLIPYLTYFMPNVKTVSILLSGSVDLAKVRYLAEQLASSEKDILLICSVDFSHYLQYNEAAQKDKETIAAIEAANFPVLADFNNDHFDSAPCVTAFLTYAQELGLTQKLHWNGSSSEIVGYGPEKIIEEGITTYQIWMLNEKN